MPTQPEGYLSTAEPLSSRNPRIKRLRKLVSQRKARSQERAFVAEGPTLLAEALRSGASVSEVYVDADRFLEDDVAFALSNASLQAQRVFSDVLSSVLDTANPQGVAAVIEGAPRELTVASLSEIPAGRPLLVLHELRDPGNAGTLLRTAEASGFGAVVLSGDSVDLTSPKTVRASAGSIFRMPAFIGGPASDAFEAIRASGRRVLATDVGDGASHHDVDLSNAAIVLGSEAHGLASEVVDAADEAITIELAGPTESLNVAAAGAIICFESLRQRRTNEGRSEQPTPNSFDKSTNSTEGSPS